MHSGTKNSAKSIVGQMNDIGKSITSHVVSAALLAHRRKTHDGADQVFFGRKRQRVHAGASVVLIEAPPPAALLAAIEDHRAPVVFTAPTAYRALLPPS